MPQPFAPITRGDYSRFVYVAAAITALNGLLFSYNTGVISGALLFVKEDFTQLAKRGIQVRIRTATERRLCD